MYVRFEECKDHTAILIDELEKYLGKLMLDEFVDLIDQNKEPLEEGGYVYWYVDKKELLKRIKK